MQTGIIIYEDNQGLREGISHLIVSSNDFILLGGFPDVLDVENQVRKLRPGVVLMDIEMPGGTNGIEAVRKIRTFDDSVAIIMLTVFDDNVNVLDAIFAGASGYLLKKHLPDRLFDAIREVQSGGAPMSPSVARLVITSMHKPSRSVQDIYQLTPREKEILVILAKGTGYKLIADQFGISLDTVRSHIKNIYQKMQVHSQLEAVAKGRDAGMV